MMDRDKGGIALEPTEAGLRATAAAWDRAMVENDADATEEAQVRIYGVVGVLVAQGISGGRFEGQPFRVAERQSNVFVHEAGEWRCVLTHLSPLPTAPSELPP